MRARNRSTREGAGPRTKTKERRLQSLQANEVKMFQMPSAMPRARYIMSTGIMTTKILIKHEGMATHIRCYRGEVKQNEKLERPLDLPISRSLRRTGGRLKGCPPQELPSQGNFIRFQLFCKSTCWKIPCSLIISNPHRLSHGESLYKFVLLTMSRSTLTD